MVVLGPPRSGKGMNLVIPAVLDAPGAGVTTSTRPDNLAVTLQARRKLGRVAVFDPQGLARGVPAGLRWSPVRGCEVPRTAMLRAAALCADAGESVTESSYWRQQTQIAVRCLLHAAAVGARPTSALYSWSLSAPMAAEAVEVLSTHPGASPGWGKALDSICGADPRTRDSIWSMVTNAFSALADPEVLEALSPEDDEAFDPEQFLRERGCLYLLGTASGASATANLVAAFIEDVVEAARRLAARSVGARLDPPLALVLDEAANYPLPSLPSLMSEGGGTGITTMAVLQSLSQARDRWGRERAGAIWDAAIVKVVLGGSANADDLADISRLVGEREAEERSVSSGSGGRTVSVSTRPRAVLEPSMLRRIGFGQALLLLRSAPPVMLTLRPWTARRDAAELWADRAELEEAVRRTA
jgi:type IV secretory pathway TraG/TraD family ATPase VirD4